MRFTEPVPITEITPVDGSSANPGLLPSSKAGCRDSVFFYDDEDDMDEGNKEAGTS